MYLFLILMMNKLFKSKFTGTLKLKSQNLFPKSTAKYYDLSNFD